MRVSEMQCLKDNRCKCPTCVFFNRCGCNSCDGKVIYNCDGYKDGRKFEDKEDK